MVASRRMANNTLATSCQKPLKIGPAVDLMHNVHQGPDRSGGKQHCHKDAANEHGGGLVDVHIAQIILKDGDDSIGEGCGSTL